MQSADLSRRSVGQEILETVTKFKSMLPDINGLAFGMDPYVPGLPLTLRAISRFALASSRHVWGRAL
jgi:hypothetical protein